MRCLRSRYKIFRNWTEQSKQHIEKATLVKDIAQWYFMDDNNGKTELKEYPDDVIVLLETALLKQEPQASFFDSDGNKYIVDFDSYEEYPEGDPTKVVKVLRKSKLVDKAGNQKPKNESQQPSQTHAVDANTMYSVDIGNLVLKIYQGDITAVKVDVIVNGTNIDLDLTKGTSNSNITVKEAAEQMFKAVEKSNSKPVNHVKEVHVVIFQQQMMTDFMAAIKECVDNSTSNNKGYVGRFLNWVSGGYIAGEKEIKISTEERRSSAQALGQRHSAAQALVDRTIDDKVTFVIYSKDQKAADSAIKLLETAIVEDHIEKSISARIIKDFTNDQIAEAKKLEQTDKVAVNVDKTNEKITIKGMTKFVATARDKVNDIVRKAEQGKQNIQKATLVKDIAQWYFMDDNNGKTELKEYPDDVTVILETALMKQEPQAFFLDSDGNKYIVDFDSYEEYPASDRTDTVKVLRKSKLVDKTFEPPATWTHMDEKENLKVVPLVSTGQEYKDVVKKFTDTARGVNVEFVKIERVQNKTLYQQYIAKKKSVDATNTPGHQNERLLWHGFAKDAMDSINRYGFNRSYCGKNLTAFGLGVYFAVESANSVQDTYSVPDKDANQHKRMYLCRVLVGEYAMGTRDTKVPPPKAAGSHILYDTVTNSVANPAMFIIFHDSQAFPEYLVTFKRQ